MLHKFYKGCFILIFGLSMLSLNHSHSYKMDEPPLEPLDDGIEVEGGFSAEDLIRDIFIGGNCFDVSNVTLNGSTSGIGMFRNGNASIQIDSGVILSSGSILNILGPNTSTSTGNSFNLTTSDPDIASLSPGGNIFDVTSIEFDFAPTVDSVSFEYVFASEEYCDYVFSPFNDVFGFFMSGPGINGTFTNGAVNLALVPGTNDYVAINSVNQQTNSSYYLDNTPQGQGQNTSAFYDCDPDINMDGVAIDLIEFDGFTTVLRASVEVIPCETYHIKLVVCDISDGIFDSAVFLKAGSFKAGVKAKLESYVINEPGSNILYEDCKEGYFIVRRFDGENIHLPYEVALTLNAASTATYGVDYAPFDTVIVIPPYTNFVIIPIDIFDDGIDEGTETILLQLENDCSCSNPFAELVIIDPPPLFIEVPDVTICEESSALLEADVSGGVPDYYVEWDDGTLGTNFIAITNQTTEYTVSVTDICDHLKVDTVEVTVIPKPIASMDGEMIICELPVDTSIVVELEGAPPFWLFYSINGVQQTPFLDINDTIFHIPVIDTGLYELIDVLGLDFCQGEASGSFLVQFPDTEIDLTINPLTCNGLNDASISVNVSGMLDPLTYNWSNSGGNSNAISGLGPGDYSVTITDQRGCEEIVSTTIDNVESFSVDLSQIDPAFCNSNSGSLQVMTTGGQSPYLYQWSTGLPDTSYVTGLSSGSYEITVTDSAGCESYAEFTIVSEDGPVILPLNLSHIDCNNPFGTITVAISGGLSPYLFNWDNGSSFDSVLVSPNPGEHELIVTDAVGCESVYNETIQSFIQYPALSTGPDQTLNCAASMVMLSGSSIDTNNLSYFWTTSNGNIISNPDSSDINVNIAGQYVFQVLNNTNGCISTDTVWVLNDDESPEVIISQNGNINCTQNLIQLSGAASNYDPGFDISWSTANGNILTSLNNIEISVDQAGTYYLEILNPLNNCIDLDSITVEEDFSLPEVEAGLGGTINCTNLDVVLTGAVSSGTSYFWYSTEGTISGNPNSLSVDALSSGWYFLEAQNSSNGCVSIDSVYVSANFSSPESVAGTNQIMDCLNNQITLDGSASSAWSTLIYEWTTADGIILSGANSLNPVVGAPGEYVLTVIDTTNGCLDISSMNVTSIVDFPEVEAGPNSIITCDEFTVSLMGEVNISTINFSMEWSTINGNITSGENNLNAAVDQEGIYYFTVIDLDNGCQSMDSVEVFLDTLSPILISPQDMVLNCLQESIVLEVNTSTSGDYTYIWSGPTDAISGPVNTDQLIVTGGGQFMVEVRNEINGCTSSETILVTEDFESPLVDAGEDQTLSCIDQMTTLQAQNSDSGSEYLIQWTSSDGSIVSGENTLNPIVSAPGTYLLEITHLQNGCSQFDQVHVQEPEPFVFDAFSLSALCESGGSIIFDTIMGGVAPYQYSIDNGLAFYSNPDFTDLSVGDYELVVVDDIGCTSFDMISVSEGTPFELNLEELITLQIGDSYFINTIINVPLNTIAQIQWEPPLYLSCTDCLNPEIISPTGDEEYTVTVIDIYGCEVQATIRLQVDINFNVYIPNIFSPNGDQINDFFTVYTDDIVEKINILSIYDRWGEKVFEREDFAPNVNEYGWNGTFRGELMNPAVFVYYTSLQLINGEIHQYSGDVTLTR